MLKAIARFILRNELAILKEDVEIANSNTDYQCNRAEAYRDMFFKLKDEYEQELYIYERALDITDNTHQ
jgi:hypothetical protein